MSLFEDGIDLDIARPGSPRRLAGVTAAIRSILRAIRNRGEIQLLEEFTDAQLADIGLTRADVRASLAGGLFDDPSGYLTAQARYRRPVIRSS
ncbi:MAG: DUF1127 domain-containing protein [Pararhizobium sp.]